MKPAKKCFQIYLHLVCPSSPFIDQIKPQEENFVWVQNWTSMQCAAKQIRRTGGEMPKSNVSPWPPVGWAPIPTLERLHVSVSDPSEPPSHRQSPEIYHFLRGVANQRICLRKKLGIYSYDYVFRMKMPFIKTCNNFIPNLINSWIWWNYFQVALIRENGRILHRDV